MGQYWCILSFESEQVMPGGKLGEFLFSDLRCITRVLCSAFVPPLTSKELREWIVLSTARIVDRRPPPKTTVLSLPNELLRKIFFEIPSTSDALSFGLTTEHIWRVGESRIKFLSERQLAPWAGTRLMCVGDYLPSGDYPSGFVLDAKHEEWMKIQAEKESEAGESDSEGTEKSDSEGTGESDSEGTGESDSKGSLTTLYELSGTFTRLQSVFPILELRVHKPYNWYERTPEDRAVYSVNRKLRGWPRAVSLEEESLILRNLTKKVYVRADATPISLAAVVVVHICWSADPSVAMAYKKDLHRGIWAGDRFDMCLMEMHEAELAKLDKETRASWKDVSDEIAEEMEAIWKSEYGDDWMKYV